MCESGWKYRDIKALAMSQNTLSHQQVGENLTHWAFAGYSKHLCFRNTKQ